MPVCMRPIVGLGEGAALQPCLRSSCESFRSHKAILHHNFSWKYFKKLQEILSCQIWFITDLEIFLSQFLNHPVKMMFGVRRQLEYMKLNVLAQLFWANSQFCARIKHPDDGFLVRKSSRFCMIRHGAFMTGCFSPSLSLQAVVSQPALSDAEVINETFASYYSNKAPC